MDGGIGDVAPDHRPVEEMHILQDIDQPGEVIEIGDGGRAIAAGLEIRHQHGNAAGAVMDAGPADIHVMDGIARMQREIAPGPGDDVFHQSARKAEPALLVDLAAMGERQLPHHGRRIAEPDLLQHVEHGLVDAGDVRLRERLVAAAADAGAHGPAGAGLPALQPPRLAPAATPSARGKLQSRSPSGVEPASMRAGEGRVRQMDFACKPGLAHARSTKAASRAMTERTENSSIGPA